MNENELIQSINEELALELPSKINADELRQQLAVYINDLVIHDFQKLVSVLYRIDISELRLKQLLKDNPDREASLLIADLIIERQLQKIKSRKEYKSDNTISDDEKW